MAIYNPNISETVRVADYRQLCMELWQPFYPFYKVSEEEMIHGMLEKLDGQWSVEYVHGGFHEDTYKVCRHGSTERPSTYTCTLGVVNWVEGDDAPSKEEIEAILPTITHELPESVYGILGDGEYWWGTAKFDFNFYDSVTFLDGDESNPRIMVTVHPVVQDEEGKWSTDYCKILANFDVKFNWTVDK
jgi:hypothetical protein